MPKNRPPDGIPTTEASGEVPADMHGNETPCKKDLLFEGIAELRPDGKFRVCLTSLTTNIDNAPELNQYKFTTIYFELKNGILAKKVPVLVVIPEHILPHPITPKARAAGGQSTATHPADKQGRLTLPASAREMAGLVSGNPIFVEGRGSYIVICSSEHKDNLRKVIDKLEKAVKKLLTETQGGNGDTHAAPDMAMEFTIEEGAVPSIGLLVEQAVARQAELVRKKTAQQGGPVESTAQQTEVRVSLVLNVRLENPPKED